MSNIYRCLSLKNVFDKFQRDQSALRIAQRHCFRDSARCSYFEVNFGTTFLYNSDMKHTTMGEGTFYRQDSVETKSKLIVYFL